MSNHFQIIAVLLCFLGKERTSKADVSTLCSALTAQLHDFSLLICCLLTEEKWLFLQASHTHTHIKVYPLQQCLDTFHKTIWPHALQTPEDVRPYVPLSVFVYLSARVHVCVRLFVLITLQRQSNESHMWLRLDSLTANMEEMPKMPERRQEWEAKKSMSEREG